MSSSNVGMRVTTSGTRASSLRSSASRIATTEKFRNDSPIVRSTRAVRATSGRAGSAVETKSSAIAPASSIHLLGARAGLVDAGGRRGRAGGIEQIVGHRLVEHQRAEMEVPRDQRFAEPFG